MFDALIGDIHNLSEELCLINLGLLVLCIQSSPDDQPSVSSVVLMLSREGALSLPKEPGFSLSRKQILPQASWGHFQVLLDTPWKTFHVDVLLSKDQSTGNSIKPFISDQVIRSWHPSDYFIRINFKKPSKSNLSAPDDDNNQSPMLDGRPIKRILSLFLCLEVDVVLYIVQIKRPLNPR